MFDLCCLDLSLNWVIRSRSPMGVRQLNIQQSSVCSGTCDWTMAWHLAGSRPQAMRMIAVSRHLPAKLLRLILDGYGVVVDHSVDALVLLHERYPLPESTHVVADMYIAGRLYSAENPVHVGSRNSIIYNKHAPKSIREHRKPAKAPG